MVRQTAATDPALAREALRGLSLYAAAEPAPPPPAGEIAAQQGPAALRYRGGAGPATVLIPSLINPPTILDLDPGCSLALSLASRGNRVLVLDWGAAAQRSAMSIADHVEQLLCPMLEQLDEPPALVGYCLGGTMAIAAAQLLAVRKLATIASPWRFRAYPADGRSALLRTWRGAREAAQQIGLLPMEVLQACFWALDPERVVAKYARFASYDPASDQARRFVALERWANDGEPLPCAAARELFEDMFRDDLPGREQWKVAGQAIAPSAGVPHKTFVALGDRLVPAATAPPADGIAAVDSGHVGMIVGGGADERLHRPLADWLAP